MEVTFSPFEFVVDIYSQWDTTENLCYRCSRGELFLFEPMAFPIPSAPALEPTIAINVLGILAKGAQAFIKGLLIFDDSGEISPRV
jgi:hypothetical protein